MILKSRRGSDCAWLGYHTGAIEGLIGPRTDAAHKAVAAEGGAIRDLKPPVAAAAGPMIVQGSAHTPWTRSSFTAPLPHLTGCEASQENVAENSSFKRSSSQGAEHHLEDA